MNEGRADYVPVFLSDMPRPVRQPAPAARRRARQRDPAGRPRVLLAGHLGGGDAVGDPGGRGPWSPRSTRRCRARSATASSTSTTSTWPSRSTYRRTPTRARRSATSSAGSASTSPSWSPDGATLQLGIGAIPAAVALALRGQAGPRRPHRDVHRRASWTWSRPASITGARKERSTAARSWRRFLMGSPRLYDFVHDNPMVEMRPADYTNDTARDPHVQHGWSRSTPRSRSTSPARSCADSIGHRSTRASAARWTSSAAPRSRRGGRAIIALPSTAARRDGLADRRRTLKRGRGRGHDAGARPDRGDRVGRRRALRPQPARARARRSSPSRTRTSGPTCAARRTASTCSALPPR